MGLLQDSRIFCPASFDPSSKLQYQKPKLLQHNSMLEERLVAISQGCYVLETLKSKKGNDQPEDDGRHCIHWSQSFRCSGKQIIKHNSNRHRNQRYYRARGPIRNGGNTSKNDERHKGISHQFIFVDLAGGAKQKITATALGFHYINVGGQSNSISIVPTGKHTIHVLCNHAVPFTLNGASHVAPYSELVDVGTYTVTISADENFIYGGYGYVDFQFQSWNDGTINPTRTVNVQAETFMAATYTHRGSCPALYVWNGTGYGYVADVSDGSGWLGYLECFNPDHTAVYSYNYPYDYIKMDSTQIQPINGLYNLKITNGRRNLLPRLSQNNCCRPSSKHKRLLNNIHITLQSYRSGNNLYRKQ